MTDYVPHRLTDEQILAATGQPYESLDARGKQAYSEALGNIVYMHLNVALEDYQASILQNNKSPTAAAVFHGISMFAMRVTADFCHSQNMEPADRSAFLATFFNILHQHFAADWDKFYAEMQLDENMTILDSLQPNNMPN